MNENDFTDNGLWTPQTYMLLEIQKWLNSTAFDPKNALSIDNNPTLDPIIFSRWPNVNIEKIVFPEHDAQNMPFIPDNQYDFVYSHQVLEHIPKPWLAAKEIVRVLKPGGIGLHTTCAFNPKHGMPAFNDYYRFLAAGLAELFDGVQIIVKEEWGNREALIYNLTIDDGHGALGGRRFNEVVGQKKDELYPWHTWIIFSKL